MKFTQGEEAAKYLESIAVIPENINEVVAAILEKLKENKNEF